MSRLAVIVLAAGKGKRMKSSLPKVLHPILGEPMIFYVLDSCSALPAERWLVVLGHGASEVEKHLPSWAEPVYQERPLGTGDAVRSAEKALANFEGSVMVVCGDTPLITRETLLSLWEEHKITKAKVTLLTAQVSSPQGYGRVIRDKSGEIVKIVEEKDASEEEKKEREINTGFYLFEKEFLFSALTRITPSNAQGEFYLTDVVRIASEEGIRISSVGATDEEEILGVNSRVELAKAGEILRKRINEKWMREGVTIVDPTFTYIGPRTKIGKDTVIHPLTTIFGESEIGEGCEIGPCAELLDVKIGRATRILYAVAHQCKVGEGVEIGPFARLRAGTEIQNGAKVGTFVEIKKSSIGEGSKVPHLSYIGDATIGKGVNVGAGTITCNFDGFRKHRTVIEDEAFIGSDTMLVAPVKVGEKAFTGAGSTITQDVPPHALAVERSEQKVIKDWAKKKRKKGGGKSE